MCKISFRVIWMQMVDQNLRIIILKNNEKWKQCTKLQVTKLVIWHILWPLICRSIIDYYDWLKLIRVIKMSPMSILLVTQLSSQCTIRPNDCDVGAFKIRFVIVWCQFYARSHAPSVDKEIKCNLYSLLYHYYQNYRRSSHEINDITWASWLLQSPASWLSFHQFAQTDEKLKIPIIGPQHLSV